MSNKELITETITPEEGNILTEMNKEGSNVSLGGVFMQADVKNRNGRVYPLSEISNAVNTANSYISQHGGIFGELDHPQSLTINMDRISHVIKELKMNGNNAVGKAQLLDTPMGQIAKTLAESGARYGISSRGTGDVNEEGKVSNYGLITCDLVVTPSAPGALPEPIYESLQQNKEGRGIISLSEAVKEDPRAQDYLKKEIMKFFDDILK